MLNAPIAPLWLIDRLSTLGHHPANTNAAPIGFMTEGSRNNHLASLAGYLRKSRGLDEAGLFAAINAVNGTSSVPMDEAEVRSIARSIAKYPAGGSLVMLDLPLSRQIAGSIAPQCRHVPELGWMAWDGARWRTDTKGGRSREFVKQALESLFEGVKATGELDQIKTARSLLSASRVNAVMGLIESDACLRAYASDFDVDENLINLANGTFDLVDSVLIHHDSNDMLTKVAHAGFDPDAHCPNFDKLLRTTLPDDHQAFVLRLFGYALLGVPAEQVFAIFVGRGANGKSTLLNAVAYTLGDYSTNVEPSSFIKQKGEHIRNDLARLKGARLVSTSELATGEILDAALVKRFTGGDTITARSLYKEHFEFTAKFVVFMTTNALPVIDGGDAALARRLTMVPFHTVLPEGSRDKDLPEKLRLESAGIFNRLLEGLSEYRSIGLAVPEDLKATAEDYCSSSDMLANFFAEICERDPSASLRAQAFYDRYHGWCSQTGIRPMSQPQFRQEMIKRLNISPKKTNSGQMWPGLRLRMLTK